MLHGAVSGATLATLMFSVSTPASGTTSTQVESASESAVQWTQFKDPVETAFTLEVPAGRNVKGGTFLAAGKSSRILR